MNDDYSTRATQDEFGNDDAVLSTVHRPHRKALKAKAVDASAHAVKSPALKVAATTTAASETHAAATTETVGVTEHTEAHALPWYHETDVWIGVAFLLFIAVAMKWVVPPITKGLDARSDKIRDQLEQANRLKAEAEALLDQYKTEQQQKLKEAESILDAARRDAESIRTRAAEELKQSLARRTAQAEEKIARAEADAIATLRRKMVDAATEAARAILLEKVTSEATDPALSLAFTAIETQLGSDSTTTKKRKSA